MGMCLFVHRLRSNILFLSVMRTVSSSSVLMFSPGGDPEDWVENNHGAAPRVSHTVLSLWGTCRVAWDGKL